MNAPSSASTSTAAATRPKSTTSGSLGVPGVLRPASVPPLEAGDRLTRHEFERRYATMPNVKKAELIEGVVYMGSPVSHEFHSRPHFGFNGWLFTYILCTPGTDAGDNATVRLDPDNEPQPDLLLRILPTHGGQTRDTDDGYIDGAPELVAEIAASSASYDLHDKLNAYRRNGVREYVVWRVRDAAVDWFVNRNGTFERLAADNTGIFRSETFPGLWLDTAAVLRGDWPAVIATLQLGLQSAEHQSFVAALTRTATGTGAESESESGTATGSTGSTESGTAGTGESASPPAAAGNET